MAVTRSPAYPGIALPQAIDLVAKIHASNRTNPVDREAAAKDMGYAGMTGSSSKALADLAHYGLIEKAGKGAVRVSQRAVDILYPASPSGKATALNEAAFAPALFGTLRTQFHDGIPSENNLRSYLMRTGFATSAIPFVLHSYRETCRVAQEEGATESHGMPAATGPESSLPEPQGDESPAKFGGAKVGDLIQWEVDGVLQMEKPMRVRLVTDDGWVAVVGSETGIPMDQVMVEERAVEAPRLFKIDPPKVDDDEKARPGETEWISNRVGKETKVRLLVSGGEMGAKEIGKLIKLLEAQKAVLTDEDEDDG